MQFSDILIVTQWWLTLLLLGVGFLPLTNFVFKPFFDRGYIFSKLLGLTIISYTIFILGLTHLTTFSATSSYIILISVSLIIFLLLKKQESIFAVIKEKWKIFIFDELIFFAALLFWAYIHSFSPDIHGLEKYMDFGMLNSILRADYFPPKDMWFTPLYINYYYFGHLMTAVLTKLSNLPSNFTFNLMLSTIFAFCFTESFSIAANLFSLFGEKLKFFQIKRLFAGLISAFLVAFSGNLHILYGFFKAYPNESPVPIWQLPFLPFSFPNGYWYPNATRFIYHTIHEFPIYSWVVADLHGHVLDIPIVLLTIAILLSFLLKSEVSQRDSGRVHSSLARMTSFWGGVKRRLQNLSKNFHIEYLLLIGFLLAVMYMTNAWDGAIYFMLTFFVIIYLNSQNTFKIKNIIISTLIVLFGFVLFTFPYNINFKPFVSGIGVLCSPQFLVSQAKIDPFIFEPDHCQHSPWWQLIMLYGFFYFFIFSFLIFSTRIKKLFQTDQFVLLLIIVSTLLILIPEFIYVKDIYPAHYRANTMFKLVFQAFIMLSLCSGYIIIRIITGIRKKLFAFCFLLFATVLVVLVLLYPYQAINSYYGNLTNYQGLNGTKYLQLTYPSDAAAIDWLNKNIQGQPVILEAQGDSYTDYARVSANTGLPTILGWTVHEWLWRGTYDIPAPRINEVKTIYESKNLSETKALLQKYHVEYVFIGNLEKEKYPAIYENKFKQLGKIVYQKDTTKIYRLN